MEFEDDGINTVKSTRIDFEAARRSVTELIKAIGEDPEREGLQRTPERVARMYSELLSGYSTEIGRASCRERV